MPVLIKVTQNNIKDSKSYGKWYGRVVSTKTMTYQELCKHMSEHNSVYGEDVCLGVANKLQNCMLEQLLEGKKVQFGELGTFYLSVKSSGANKEADFNLGVNINGLFLCFAPSRTDVNNLSSKMLKKKATFMNVKDLVESKTKPTNGGGGSTTNSGSDSSNPGGNSTETPETPGTSDAVAAPVITGTTPFTDSTSVTMSGPDGAEIRYTTDGSDPTAESSLYSEALTLTDTTTVKAIAIKDGESSSIASKTFTKTGESGGFDLGN
jgi:predicted histone-like DNA-binding protein